MESKKNVIANHNFRDLRSEISIREFKVVFTLYRIAFATAQ